MESPSLVHHQRIAANVCARRFIPPFIIITTTTTMSNDPTVRRLLPQNSQMGSFSFAPPAYQQQPREMQKSAPLPLLFLVMLSDR